MSIENPISINNVSKEFVYNKNKDKISALKNINMNIKKGELVGIIGKNGSGKTTLLRIIAGIYKPDTGSIKISGKIAPLLQIGVGFYNELTPRDNILLYGMLLGLKKHEIKNKINKIIEFAEIEKFKETKLKFFSSGMKARLAFSTALEINPDILLVDEILSVGDLGFREKSFNAFLSFKENKKTIILCSHNLSMISKLCDRVLLLDQGNQIMIGEPQEVIKEYRKMTETGKK